MAERVRTSDRIYEQLREAIISGSLPAGAGYSIYQLAETYGVSRTPVRDAVLRLADARMLDIERNQGIVIRGLRVDDVREIFELRLLIEVPLAGFAADATNLQSIDEAMNALDRAAAQADRAEFLRFDRLLHRSIATVAGNASAADVIDALRDRTETRDVSTLARERSLAHVHAEHMPIVQAIHSHDAEAARATMRQHLVSTGELLMKQVADRSGEEFVAQTLSRE